MPRLFTSGLGNLQHRILLLLIYWLINCGKKVSKLPRTLQGRETGFVGVYFASKPGPVLAFLAEYDALPGIGHACGHNSIRKLFTLSS